MKRIFDSVLWALDSLWGAIFFTGIVFLLLGFVCSLAGYDRAVLHLIGAKFTDGGFVIAVLCVAGGISYLLGLMFTFRIDPMWPTYTFTIGSLVIVLDLFVIMGIAIAGVDMVSSDWGVYMLLVGLLGVFICLVVTFFLKGAIVEEATPDPVRPEKVGFVIVIIDGGDRPANPHLPKGQVNPPDPNQDRSN